MASVNRPGRANQGDGADPSCSLRPLNRRLVALFLLLLAGTSGCNVLDRLRRSDAGLDAATTDAAPPAAPIDASVADAAPAPVPSASTKAAPTRTASAAPVKGDCRCLPDEGSTEHGNNMRLAPTWVLPTCECSASGVSLCQQPIKTCKERGGACNESFSDLCKSKYGFKGTAGGSCQGWDSTGAKSTGKLGCQFETSVDTYPRTPGGTCTGFTVDHKSVKGHIFCR